MVKAMVFEKRLPEQRLWDDVRNSMGNRWFAKRIEDRLGAGLPDVYFAGRKKRGAWMELKVLPNLPQEHRKFDIAHFTPDQRAFGLQMLQHAGANYWWLMTRLGPVDHLHRATIIDFVGEVQYSVFRKKAVWVGDVTAPGSADAIADLILA
jgi:hypothetical protein